MAFATFMARLDSYIVNIALPAISRHFQVGTGEVSWVVLAYFLTLTSTLLLFGKVGERIGVKKLFIPGYLVFSLSSLLCGLSPSIRFLVASRCLQGAGAAMLVTSAFAIIPRYLPAEITGWAFGLTSTAAALGVIVGAPLGGLITGFASWRWVFLINVPVGVAATVVAGKVLPTEPAAGDREKETRFDLPGAILCFVGLLSLLYALNMGGELGWKSPAIIVGFAVAAFCLSAFVFRERKYRFPLLDLSLFRNAAFTYANLTTLMAFILLSGGNFLLPFFLELVKGLKPEAVGLMMLAYSGVFLLVGPVAGRMSDRVPPRRLCGLAMLLAGASSLLLAFTLARPGLVPVFRYLILLGMSYGFFIAPNNNLVMSLAPRQRQSVASGAFNTIFNLGTVLGVCLFETIFSSVLPAGMGGLADRRIPSANLLPAFRHAFILGAVACFLAFLFTLLARDEKSAAGDKGRNQRDN